MKRIFAAIAASLFILFAFLFMQRVLRTDEALIRNNLKHLASLLSKPEGEAVAASLIKAGRAAEYFTEDCKVIKVNGYSAGGRPELFAAIQKARQNAQRISVRLYDIEIDLTDGNSAEANLSAAASADGLFGEITARELKLILIKRDGEWKIKSAETIEVLR
jgi:ketosteroid isomerase-like protein